ncbi:MAG: hypothetical protein JJU29_08155 [Verrucomicrobia bacterium]|nr:hypothetical protein [Verrucomicrobiota bacterium]MCH8512084.1 hypothetical protein [Kiritimatiellia bacterium]
MAEVKTGKYTKQIQENGKEISRLHARIHEKFNKSHAHRDDEEAWKNACAEFHARFDELAFPGGLNTAYERVESGEPDAVEAALCFLECRPYFFRSGYIWKKLLRKMKKAELSQEQQTRFEVVREDLNRYKKHRNA